MSAWKCIGGLTFVVVCMYVCMYPVLKRSPQLEGLRYVKCQCAQCTSSVATCTFMCTTLCMAGVAPHAVLGI